MPAPTQAILDGRSFAPCLTGSSVAERPTLIEMGYGRAVVWNGWKYIAVRYPPAIAAKADKQKLSLLGRRELKDEAKTFPAFSDRDQLFNLNDDLLEQKNIASDPAYADKLLEMKQKLTGLLAPLPHVFGEFKTSPSQP